MPGEVSRSLSSRPLKGAGIPARSDNPAKKGPVEVEFDMVGRRKTWFEPVAVPNKNMTPAELQETIDKLNASLENLRKDFAVLDALMMGSIKRGTLTDGQMAMYKNKEYEIEDTKAAIAKAQLLLNPPKPKPLIMIGYEDETQEETDRRGRALLEEDLQEYYKDVTERGERCNNRLLNAFGAPNAPPAPYGE